MSGTCAKLPPKRKGRKLNPSPSRRKRQVNLLGSGAFARPSLSLPDFQSSLPNSTAALPPGQPASGRARWAARVLLAALPQPRKGERKASRRRGKINKKGAGLGAGFNQRLDGSRLRPIPLSRHRLPSANRILAGRTADWARREAQGGTAGGKSGGEQIIKGAGQKGENKRSVCFFFASDGGGGCQSVSTWERKAEVECT